MRTPHSMRMYATSIAWSSPRDALQAALAEHRLPQQKDSKTRLRNLDCNFSKVLQSHFGLDDPHPQTPLRPRPDFDPLSDLILT